MTQGSSLIERLREEVSNVAPSPPCLEGERWLPVLQMEGYYQISSLGRVWSHPRQGTPGGFVTPCIVAGYYRVDLRKRGWKKQWFVHRLVLDAFVGPQRTLQAAHNNGDRLDNRLENLRWATARENMCDVIDHGNISLGEKHAIASRLGRERARQKREAHQKLVDERDELLAALEGAEETLDQILDDMRDGGQCVCLAVKNEAIDTLANVRTIIAKVRA